MLGGDTVHDDCRRVELRRDAVGIGGDRLNLHAKLDRGGGARGDGRGGAGVRPEGGEASGGFHLLGDRFGADRVGSPVDLEIDLDVGGEKAAAATRRLLDVLDDDVRRENAEIFGEAGLEFGLEAGAVGVNGALRFRELNLRLDGELDALYGNLFSLDVAADGVGDGFLECFRLGFVHGVEAQETQRRFHLG